MTHAYHPFHPCGAGGRMTQGVQAILLASLGCIKTEQTVKQYEHYLLDSGAVHRSPTVHKGPLNILSTTYNGFNTAPPL